MQNVTTSKNPYDDYHKFLKSQREKDKYYRDITGELVRNPEYKSPYLQEKAKIKRSKEDRNYKILYFLLKVALVVGTVGALCLMVWAYKQGIFLYDF